MKKTTLVLLMLMTVGLGLLAQGADDFRTLRADMLAVLTGDTARFERGMRTLESLLAKSPDDPQLKVLHGTGVFARAGDAFGRGDVPTGMKLFQSSLAEMAEAVKMAPDNILVRARRGVVLITASRSMPAPMATSLTQLAVDDFERVLEIRERDRSLARGSAHQRGELLTALADGWSRLGDAEKARGYFLRITKDLAGTPYEIRAAAWLADAPQAKSTDYFSCSGCHVE